MSYTFRWSTKPDGFGYYYGFASQDHRQLNVRRVFVLESQIHTIRCEAFVGGEYIGEYDTIAEAQVACEEHIKGAPP